MCCNISEKFKLHFLVLLRNFLAATELRVCKGQVQCLKKKKEEEEYTYNHLIKQVVKRRSVQQRCSLGHLLWAVAPSQFTDAVPPN